MDIIRAIEAKQIKENAENFSVGDTVRVSFKIVEQSVGNSKIQAIEVSGADKQVVGEISAQIRGYRKPEPYLGKGIKYENEVIIRKEGKRAGKK